jgi:acyl-CoA hydrolase
MEAIMFPRLCVAAAAAAATMLQDGCCCCCCWQVAAIFGSSLEVMISVFGEKPHEGRVFHCADAFATVVVVDQQVRSTRCFIRSLPPVGMLEPENETFKLQLWS